MGKRWWGIVVLLCLLCPSLSQGQAVTSGLTGRWRFNETTGDQAADSVGGHTCQFVVTADWRTGAVCAEAPGCVATTSSTPTQYCGTGTALSTVFTASAKTVALWVQLAGTPGSGAAVYDLRPIVSDASGYFGLYWGAIGGGAVTLHGYNWDTNADVVSAPSYTAGTRVHIAITQGNAGGTNTLRLYVNGVSVGTPVASGATDSAGMGSNLRMWDASTSAACTLCISDELLTYNRELSAAEVGQLAGVAPAGTAFKRRSFWVD